MAMEAAAAARAGPFAVGVQTVAVAGPDGRTLSTTVWYPATTVEGRAESTSLFGVPNGAFEDAPPRPGEHALVLFSHGNGGVNTQSTFLMVHLASHGFVVAAPEHVGNTAMDIPPESDLDSRREAHRQAVQRRPADLVAVFRRLTEPAGHSPSALPRCRTDQVGVAGHSFGGWTALKLAAQRVLPVAAVLALAPAGEPFVGRRAFAAVDWTLPREAPALLIASDLDVLVDLDASVRPLAARLGPNHQLLVMRATDHYHYCDGAEEIHTMQADMRRGQDIKQSLPFAQLVSEDRAHRILKAAGALLFQQTLHAHVPPAQVLALPWETLDPCIQIADHPPAARL